MERIFAVDTVALTAIYFDGGRGFSDSVEAVVARRVRDARARLVGILESSGCTPSRLDAAVEAVRQYARVVLHF